MTFLLTDATPPPPHESCEQDPREGHLCVDLRGSIRRPRLPVESFFPNVVLAILLLRVCQCHSSIKLSVSVKAPASLLGRIQPRGTGRLPFGPLQPPRRPRNKSAARKLLVRWAPSLRVRCRWRGRREAGGNVFFQKSHVLFPVCWQCQTKRPAVYRVHAAGPAPDYSGKLSTGERARACMHECVCV